MPNKNNEVMGLYVYIIAYTGPWKDFKINVKKCSNLGSEVGHFFERVTSFNGM